MRDTLKFAGSVLMVQVILTVALLAFAPAMLGEIEWLNLVMTLVFLLAYIFLGYFEGMNRGRRDRMFQAMMEKQEETRGVAPTPEERQRFYSKGKGFIAALLAASPSLIVAVIMLFLRGEAAAYGTVIARLLLGAFIGVYQYVENLMPYIYLPLAALFPVAVGVGYLMGPKMYEKTQQQIAESKKRLRRRRKKKVKQPNAQ